MIRNDSPSIAGARKPRRARAVRSSVPTRAKATRTRNATVPRSMVPVYREVDATPSAAVSSSWVTAYGGGVAAQRRTTQAATIPMHRAPLTERDRHDPR